MTRRHMDDDSSEESGGDGRSATVCFLCRQRKTKCDRTLPSCGFCLKAKVDCQYVPKPNKRGLRAGYVSQLENRLEHLESEIESLKREETSRPSSQALQSPLSTVHAAPAGDTPASFSPPQRPAVWTAPTPAKRQRLNPETDAAVRDLMTLPNAYLYTLAETWFKENQPWCPILSHEHIMDAAASLPTPVEYIEDIELRAVLALELSYSTQAICLGYHGRRRLSQYLRSQVLTEALSDASLGSVRALVIVGLMDYGADNIASTFSLLSVCRRTCEHLGLFKKLLSQIQGESPSQVGPPPVNTSGGGHAHMISVAWATLGLDAVSTLGVSWRDASAALVDHLSSIAYVSTPYLRDSYRAHVHLAAIGLQPVHQFLYERSQMQVQTVDENTLIKCDEMYQNLMSYVHGQPRTRYTILENGLVDFDPNLVHTETLVYATTVMIYQGLVDFHATTPDVPLQRCVKVCNENMVTLVRSISDADAELNTPLLAHFFFVAARFKLVMCMQLSEPTDIAFDTIMHTINMCARRWGFARRLDIVLRGAVVELNGGPPVPPDFWDLKRSHLDISEELKQWSSLHKGLHLDGSTSGPYSWLSRK
ncbi:uncharacterized protein HMPREF1541_02819 [Cyphellophora europaea CBS 101466]|uniref:Zn(2)-C6 fungal-type domain-containing protein n=1 Tax=Cyphellophora europaea (strain CBS 101466) TaxID=1220924 RepID=W2S4X9_CYPE1|nr:uncharacterized protein HMPREF1541_02819 [Cyphellophora europaea CBS 101466]ETN43660.1 hypothetical protein HMPREF1541_02819 [Cyphellophora europaea CBS 101466]